MNAITTFGLSPIAFLVLPRLVAAFLVVPLLTVLADIVGLFGAALVMIRFDIGFVQFYRQLLGAVTRRRLHPRHRQGRRLWADDRRDRMPPRSHDRRRCDLSRSINDRRGRDEHCADHGDRRLFSF